MTAWNTNLADRLEASCTEHGHTPCLCRLAAYRIRDLEAALREIMACHVNKGTSLELWDIARAALEERK